MKKRTFFDVILKLIILIKPLLPFMFVAILMGVAGFLSAIFITVFAGYALLNVLGFSSSFNTTTIFFIIVFLAIIRGFLRYAEQASNHYIAFKILASIRDKVFTSLRNLATAKLEGKDKGNLISIITSDIELLEVFYAHTISPIVIAIIVSIVMTLFISSYHYILGVVALFSYITIGVIIPYFIAKKSNKLGASYRNEFGEINSFFLDSIMGIREIVQFNGGDSRLEDIENLNKSMNGIKKEMQKNTGKNTALTGVAISFFSGTLFFISSFLYLNGSIDFSGVVITTIAIFSSFGSVVAVSNLGSGLANTVASGNRVLDILDEKPIINDVTTGEDVVFTGANFKDVSFSYDNNNILKDLNIDINTNQIIGISGKSGSGKSTALKLLMRFFDVSSGSVNISSVNIKNVNTDSLRKNQSLVTQETHIFSGTIKENLRIANLSASDEDIILACKKASLHDFIMSLEKGYDTPTSELGTNLSGGERQRIGVARAFIHASPLILLDEPTSNLDGLNESVILKSLQQEKTKTIVLVSHRESTMKITDTIYSVQSNRFS